MLMTPIHRPAHILIEIQSEARRQQVPIRQVDPRELEALAPEATMQGVAALVSLHLVDSIERVVELSSRVRAEPFLLVLDQVQDPHNFGALLRSAEATGIQAVVVPERRSAPLAGTVAKTSAGALSLLPIFEATNLARALDELKESGVWLIGLDADASVDLFKADLTLPLALIIGSEGKGLRRLTKERCDLLVRLPMHGSIESLNASVAGSVAMFECVRQRSDNP